MGEGATVKKLMSALGGGRPHGRQAQGDEAAREELPGGGAGKVTEAKLSDSLS